jgi:redox-sensing transcriptional repressor
MNQSERGKKRADSGIAAAVIQRLPVYQRYLNDLRQKEVERISSGELAARIGITASQLRQDLSCFGSFGQQGYGYKVNELLEEVNKILGLDHNIYMVLIGAGNLGRAILSYPGFKKRNFCFQAAFDLKINHDFPAWEEIELRPVSELENYLAGHSVDIGVITTPADSAQAIADILIAGGVKGIWNFAPVALKAPEHVVVEDVHISESLLVLSYRVHHQK